MHALQRIGANPASRKRLTQALRDLEPDLAVEGLNVRAEITGPLVDILHQSVPSVDITLANGLAFSMLYTGTIARDIAMRAEAHPDHVFEPQTTKTLLHLAREARDIIIGGAYAGDHAVLLAASIAAVGGRIHAFEPNRRQLDALKANASRNGLTNVIEIGLGLWSDESTRLSFVGSDELAQTTPAADGEIAVTTIDAYCARVGIERLGLIMLDIEGSEFEVLRGASRMLSGARPPTIVFEVHRSYVDWSQGLAATPIGAYLSGLGYGLYAIRDFQSHVHMPGLPVELVPAETAYLDGPPHGFNMLAIKDPAVIADPLFTIVPNVSPKLLHHRARALHYPLAWQNV